MIKLEKLRYKKLSEPLNYENHKPYSAEINSGRYKNDKNILKPNNLQGE